MQFQLHPATDGFPDVKPSDWNSRDACLYAHFHKVFAMGMIISIKCFRKNDHFMVLK